MLQKKASTGDTGPTGVCDCSELEARVSALETQVQYLFTMVTPSAMRTELTEDPNLAGIGTSVIEIGDTYNYWGVGDLDNAESLQNGQTYYIATADQFPELANYQGAPTITTLWIQKPGEEPISVPAYMDNTGIYFHPTNTLNKLPADTTFRFTQSLILGTSASA